MQQHVPPSSAAATSGPSPPVFILDVGTRNVKAGLHTAASPHLTTAIVGTPRYARCLPAGPSPAPAAMRIGHDARRQRGLLRLAYPVQHGGVIADWEAARPLLQHSVRAALADSGAVAHALRDNTADVIYSLVENPFASRPQRAKLAEWLFESSASDSRMGPRAAGVFCGASPLLALFATGQTTGLVVDVGDGGLCTAAAVDGYVVSPCLQRDASGASGAAMTTYLTRLLYQSGVLGPASAAALSAAVSAAGPRAAPPASVVWGAGAGTAQERELVYDVKEACCTVSPMAVTSRAGALPDNAGAATPSVTDVSAALIDAGRRAQQAGAESRSLVLPDGQSVCIGAAEVSQAAEVLFCPALLGLEGAGVVDAVLRAVAAAPAEVQAQLLGNVVLTGGATCCPGFAKRVFHELQHRLDGAAPLSPLRGQRVCVTAPEKRAHAGWLGASFVAQLSTFVPHMVVSRATYEEEGEAALAKKVLT